MKRGRNSLFYIMFIVIVCLLWGVGNPVIKIGLGSLDVFYALGLRYVIAIVIFFAVFKKDLVKKLKRADRKPLAAVSFMTAAEFITGNLAIMLSSATVAGFLMCISIIFTPFLSGLMLKTRMDRRSIKSPERSKENIYLRMEVNPTRNSGMGHLVSLSTIRPFRPAKGRISCSAS